MTTKQCFKCNKTLPLDHFYKHSKMSNGRVNKCKECTKIDVRNNRLSKIDYYREYDKARASNPNRVLGRAEYANSPEGIASHNAAKKRWSENNAIKRGASYIVNNAIRDGKLIKPESCSSCGSKSVRLEGHHCDYSKPIDVIWLCSKCHRLWHKLNSPINGN